MSSWFKRLFDSNHERAEKPVRPTGNEHDYRPPRCDRSHDWSVLQPGTANGGQTTMRIEAWGTRFRAGDRIVIGDPAEKWWIIRVTAEGNTWFPDRAVLDLTNTLEHA